jgi:sulfatase maturation enzyme AslB (radical SAM superfamily)
MHLATNASGRFRLCCNSLPGKNLLQDGERIYSAHVPGDFRKGWNSSFMRQVRQDMLAGRRPEACTRCFREEDSGLKSARQAWNEAYAGEIETYLTHATEDGRAEPAVKYMDLRLGNLCNLKCRMCNPYASKKWLEEWGLIEGPLPEDEASRLRHLNWFEDEGFWAQLEEYLDGVDQIYLTGGEPMLIKAQYRLLKTCVERGFAGRITLKYNTNATYVPHEITRWWPKFKKVRVNISLDGVGELNDYIRHPSKWAEIEESLAKYDALGDSPAIVLTVHCTVQAYNFLRLTELFDYLGRFKNIRRLPYLNILNHPHRFNIRALPEALKLLGEDRLRRWLEDNRGDVGREEPEYFAKASSLLSYLRAEDWSGDHWPDFLKYTQALDRSRGQNLHSVVPELGVTLG